ncbi:MAG TPA: hypothetical protein VFV34_05845 [Blastocatellia bacterium]|nr:hypothetical protein [Blastocatellia bacterium]
MADSSGRLFLLGVERWRVIDTVAVREQQIIKAIVWSVAFSPDGRWLVSAHGDGSILVWDVAEHKRVANFNEHSDPVRVVAFSRDGKRLASAGDDFSIIVWDLARNAKDVVLSGHNARVTGVDWSPDGSWLASCDLWGNVLIWDTASGEPIRRINHPSGWGNTSEWLAVSPDGRWVGATHGVYDAETGTLVANLYGIPEKDWIQADPWVKGGGLLNPAREDKWLNQPFGAFSNDGRWLNIVGGVHLGLLEIENWKVVNHTELAGTQQLVATVSRDGKLLATGDIDAAIRLFDAKTLQKVTILGRHAARPRSPSHSRPTESK